MDDQIDRVARITLGGVRQKIHIRTRSVGAPVLLVLHGGPGVSNRGNIMERHDDLADDFTVVTWDQRGTGGSYFGVPKETLTREQLIEDAKDLVAYLREELHTDKIFILGGSWGTELGTFLVSRYPDGIAGYIGYGQVVNGVLNETISFAYAMNKATEAGDATSVKRLNRVGPPKGGLYQPVFKGLMTERRILKKYGGHAIRKGTYWTDAVKPILLSREYSLSDKWGMIRGYKLCLTYMWPTIVNYDFTKECRTFTVPYHIFQGVYDNTTPSSLLQEYYDAIEAPEKSLIWFEHSAHGPLNEEPARFKALLREKFLGKPAGESVAHPVTDIT